jgi:lysyl-tRNA synthetase class 2
MKDTLRWKTETEGTSRMFRLKQRQQVISAIREDLSDQGFLEVETPLLIKGTCPDVHIDSIPAGDGYYLATSTEYQIKRMFTGGFEKVFTLTKNFRANDRGRYHSHEFTMLEWARAFKSLHDIEEDVIRFTRKAFRKLYPNQNTLHFNNHAIDFITKDWESLTVRNALEKHLGLTDLEDFSLEPLLCASKQVGLEIPKALKQNKYMVMSFLMDKLQAHLGYSSPTFLKEWPAYQTTSAPISSSDPYTAERTELYIAGIEISDGFPFLRDVRKQRNLFRHEQLLREEMGKPTVTLDELFLKALEEGLPPGAGMALGIDRLVMVLTGSQRLSDVQAFDWDEL